MLMIVAFGMVMMGKMAITMTSRMTMLCLCATLFNHDKGAYSAVDFDDDGRQGP